jgi:hypothetical protein
MGECVFFDAGDGAVGRCSADGLLGSARVDHFALGLCGHRGVGYLTLAVAKCVTSTPRALGGNAGAVASGPKFFLETDMRAAPRGSPQHRYRLLFLGDNQATSAIGLRHTQREAHSERLEGHGGD